MADEFYLTPEDVLILRQVCGWFKTRSKTETVTNRPAVMLLGKAAADIPKGSSGEVEIYLADENKGSEEASGDKVQCYARMGDVPAGWVYVLPIVGGLEVVAPECSGA